MSCPDWTKYVVDRTLSAEARIEAARRVAQECRDYSVWKALCSVVADEGDDAEVRCAVVRALPDWNRNAAAGGIRCSFGDGERSDCGGAGECVRCAALGCFADQKGNAVVKHLLNDGDPDVVTEAQKALPCLTTPQQPWRS